MLIYAYGLICRLDPGEPGHMHLLHELTTTVNTVNTVWQDREGVCGVIGRDSAERIGHALLCTRLGRRNSFGHSCRAGRPGPNRERSRRGRRNVSAVCRPFTPDAIRRGLVQPLGTYTRHSGSLRCGIASVCACMTRSTGLLDTLPVQNVQNNLQANRIGHRWGFDAESSE